MTTVRSCLQSVPNRVIGGLALVFAFCTCQAQEPYFGRAGFWERTSKATNQTFEGKPEAPASYKENGCGRGDARLAGPRDPFFQSIDRADRTCTYADIKGSPNSLSWSFQCAENPPHREGKSLGKVHHQYDPGTETVVQRYSIFVEVLLVPPGRLVNVTADHVQSAHRVRDCQPSDRGRRAQH
jgi:hypothetical protein